MMATFNVVNELESFYNRGKAIGQWILDSWDKVIEGVDKAAVKRARELKDRLATEAAEREQAYTDALTNAKRERIYDEEQRRITAINELYSQRIQLIGQLAANRTAEVDTWRLSGSRSWSCNARSCVPARSGVRSPRRRPPP